MDDDTKRLFIEVSNGSRKRIEDLLRKTRIPSTFKTKIYRTLENYDLINDGDRSLAPRRNVPVASLIKEMEAETGFDTSKDVTDFLSVAKHEFAPLRELMELEAVKNFADLSSEELLDEANSTWSEAYHDAPRCASLEDVKAMIVRAINDTCGVCDNRVANQSQLKTHLLHDHGVRSFPEYVNVFVVLLMILCHNRNYVEMELMVLGPSVLKRMFLRFYERLAPNVCKRDEMDNSRDCYDLFKHLVSIK